MNFQYAAVAILAGLCVGILISLLHSNASHRSKIVLEDLLLGDDGKISRVALAFWICCLVSNWLMVYLTMRDKMTEGYFGLYLAAWVGPIIAKLIFNQTAMPAATGSTTTTEVSAASKTTTVTPPPEGEGK